MAPTAPVRLAVAYDEFHFDFREEIHGVFAAAIDFGMAFLPAKAFHFADSHAFDANFAEGVFDLLQFERFYDRFDFLHVCLC
jgi:hypothetical protein